MSDYLRAVKWGIFGGIIILLGLLLILAAASFSDILSEQKRSDIQYTADGKLVPVPASEDMWEFMAWAIWGMLIALIIPITGAMTVRNILHKSANIKDSVIISAIAGVVSAITLHTGDVAIRIITIFTKNPEYFGAYWSINDEILWQLNIYKDGLLGIIIIGMILSIIGGLAYIAYLKLAHSDNIIN
ncbi:hypothetical protein CUJ83_08480 [Methanocella sp. CWC-04]|uniref:Uncharacterized protein n=1 Tax=Methanooceanicella nereidis TaxID=2052831 RepID=A0AAP2W7G3_9EURY|nr:hypothetical protein [Methanocella sp. CWC-04]MCD1295031.1 hypothetical protein [Methanocella sp. CWC-04]